MPLDQLDYTDLSIALGDPDDFETPQALELRVDPAMNSGADILCFYSGILRFVARGKSHKNDGGGDWTKGFLNARLSPGAPTAGRNWTDSSVQRPGWTAFRGGTATLSPSSILYTLRPLNEEAIGGIANEAGWAVDAELVEAVKEVGPEGELGVLDHLRIQARLAVRDLDAYLLRVSYQVTALGSYIPGPGDRAVSPGDRPAGRGGG